MAKRESVMDMDISEVIRDLENRQSSLVVDLEEVLKDYKDEEDAYIREDLKDQARIIYRDIEILGEEARYAIDSLSDFDTENHRLENNLYADLRVAGVY
jgi:hypothetical protein